MENWARGSLLTIGGIGYDTTERTKQPLSDITNVAIPETPRANTLLEEEDIALEEVPTAPLKSEVKVQKSLKTTSGKRLKFEDENSLHHIRIVNSSESNTTAYTKQPVSEDEDEEMVLAPPPALKKQGSKIRKRYNISGKKQFEERVSGSNFSLCHV